MPKIVVPKKKRAAVVITKKTRGRPRKATTEEVEIEERPALRKKITEAAAPAKKKTSTTETVEQQILRITDASPREKNETMEEYTLRLAEAIDDQDHPEYWKKLDRAGKDWFSAAVKAINKSEAPPAFDDGDGDGDDVGDGNGEDEQQDAFKEGIAGLVEILCDDVELDEDALVKKAKRAKVDLTEEAVRNAHSIIIATLEALDEAGRIK